MRQFPLSSLVLAVSLALATLCVPLAPACGADLLQRLQDASVTVKAGNSQGSGVLVTRTIEGQKLTFVLTAGHVIAGLKKNRTITTDGTEKKVVEFDDVGIVQEFQESGRRVGETNIICRVLRYSDAELGEDLAVMQVRKSNFTDATTDFYLDEAIPPIGTELYHVGSLKGQFGSNSLTTGVIAQTGRVIDLAGGGGVVFDQTTATAFPGSSGGGVYLKADGRHVGVLVRGAGEGFNFIVPSRRLNGWCKEVGVEWLVNSKAKLPTLDELKKMSVSDTPDVRAGSSFLRSADSLRFPTLEDFAGENVKASVWIAQ